MLNGSARVIENIQENSTGIHKLEHPLLATLLAMNVYVVDFQACVVESFNICNIQGASSNDIDF